jgi:transposase
MVKGIPRGRYTKEFREEAVRLVVDEKISRSEVSRRLSLAASTIVNWVKAYEEGRLGEVGKSFKLLTEIEMELAKVKKENAELRMERDILKKAAAYFARESLPGARQ